MFYAKQQVNKPKPALGAPRHLWLSDLDLPVPAKLAVNNSWSGALPRGKAQKQCLCQRAPPAVIQTWIFLDILEQFPVCITKEPPLAELLEAPPLISNSLAYRRALSMCNHFQPDPKPGLLLPLSLYRCWSCMALRLHKRWLRQHSCEWLIQHKQHSEEREPREAPPTNHPPAGAWNKHPCMHSATRCHLTGLPTSAHYKFTAAADPH